MTNKQQVHSDFETIERPTQNYRISTKVEYRVGMGEYVCRAKLYKSYGGRVRYPNDDRMHRARNIVSDEDEIDSALTECIESCRETLDEIEDAKDVSVDVSIDD